MLPTPARSMHTPAIRCSDRAGMPRRASRVSGPSSQLKAYPSGTETVAALPGADTAGAESSAASVSALHVDARALLTSLLCTDAENGGRGKSRHELVAARAT